MVLSVVIRMVWLKHRCSNFPSVPRCLCVVCFLELIFAVQSPKWALQYSIDVSVKNYTACVRGAKVHLDAGLFSLATSTSVERPEGRNILFRGLRHIPVEFQVQLN